MALAEEFGKAASARSKLVVLSYLNTIASLRHGVPLTQLNACSGESIPTISASLLIEFSLIFY